MRGLGPIAWVRVALARWRKSQNEPNPAKMAARRRRLHGVFGKTNPTLPKWRSIGWIITPKRRRTKPRAEAMERNPRDRSHRAGRAERDPRERSHRAADTTNGGTRLDSPSSPRPPRAEARPRSPDRQRPGRAGSYFALAGRASGKRRRWP